MSDPRPAASLRYRLDEFALRQFAPAAVGTKISLSGTRFMAELTPRIEGAPGGLRDGYAAFCKHLIVPNWMPDVSVGAIPITEANRHLLQTGYFARVPEELPVLSRWFSGAQVRVPVAKYLDVILYSREQIHLEEAALGRTPSPDDYDYGVIGIKGQLEDFELPMAPLTMMRNALGKEHGGSGAPLDRAAYMRAVDYWGGHAMVRFDCSV